MILVLTFISNIQVNLANVFVSPKFTLLYTLVFNPTYFLAMSWHFQI